jgi:hypothetical protein
MPASAHPGVIPRHLDSASRYGSSPRGGNASGGTSSSSRALVAASTAA